MAYGSTDGVAYLLPAMGRITASSRPINTTAVSAWLDEGASVINRTLAGAGYTVPVLSSTAVYDELSGLNNLYAMAQAVRARGLDTVTGDNEDRSSALLTEFYNRLTQLAGSTLADVPTSTGGAATGRRIRVTQIKRVDGYSAPYDDDTDMDA
jgi:hypothetical protein